MQLYSRNQDVAGDRSPARSRPTATLTPMELLSRLGVTPDAAWRDLEYVQDSASSFDAEVLSQVRDLAHTAAFQDWLGADTSAFLVADGFLADHAAELVSPISCFCAALAPGLADADRPNVVLTFFAGLHANPPPSDAADDGGGGPNLLVRSLAGQLLLSRLLDEPDLGFLSTPGYLDDLAQRDLGALCDVVVQLVRQLPQQTVVYCLVDGVSHYERRSWLGGLLQVANMLEHEFGRSAAPTVKVLMASAGNSMELVRKSRGRNAMWGHASLVPGYE